MSVTNAENFVKDDNAKYGVRKAVAKLAVVNEAAVAVNLSLVARRLKSVLPLRLLSATGLVDASYTVAIGGANSATDVQNRLAAVSQEDFNAAVTSEVNAASSTPYTIKILSIRHPSITGGTRLAPSFPEDLSELIDAIGDASEDIALMRQETKHFQVMASVSFIMVGISCACFCLGAMYCGATRFFNHVVHQQWI